MTFSAGSYCGPRKANGAMIAPALTPVTTSNSGRSPRSVQPARTPAPKAPSDPPPESASDSTTGLPLILLLSRPIVGMFGVWRRMSPTGSFETSSAQKRTPSRPATWALSASAAVGMPWRSIVDAQPVSATAANAAATPARMREKPNLANDPNTITFTRPRVSRPQCGYKAAPLILRQPVAHPYRRHLPHFRGASVNRESMSRHFGVRFRLLCSDKRCPAVRYAASNRARPCHPASAEPKASRQSRYDVRSDHDWP